MRIPESPLCDWSFGSAAWQAIQLLTHTSSKCLSVGTCVLQHRCHPIGHGLNTKSCICSVVKFVVLVKRAPDALGVCICKPGKYLATCARTLETVRVGLLERPYNLFKDGSHRNVRPGSTRVCYEPCRCQMIVTVWNFYMNNRRHGSSAAKPCSHCHQHIGALLRASMAEKLLYV